MSSDPAVGTRVRAAGFGASAILVGVAFAGAATAGSLSSVGPYLLGISGLIASLFVLGSLFG